MTDFDAGDAERQIIILDRLDNFESDNPPQWSILSALCQRTVEYYRDTGTPMYILLRSESPRLTCAGLMSI